MSAKVEAWLGRQEDRVQLTGQIHVNAGDYRRLVKLARLAVRAKHVLADVTYDDDQAMLDWHGDYDAAMEGL